MQQYRTIHGTETTDVDMYVRSYSEVALRLLLYMPTYTLHSFNPGLTFKSKDGAGNCFTMPADAAVALDKALSR